MYIFGILWLGCMSFLVRLLLLVSRSKLVVFLLRWFIGKMCCGMVLLSIFIIVWWLCLLFIVVIILFGLLSKI